MNEESRDGGDARVDKAFHSDLGFVEPFHLVGSVVAFGATHDGCAAEPVGHGGTWRHHVAPSSSYLEQNRGSDGSRSH